MVFEHLSTISKACLALSCKPIYQNFKYVLDSPSFKYPYSDGPERSRVDSRYELLSKFDVDRDRWRLCQRCLMFEPSEKLDTQTRLKYRTCEGRGVTFLCPCLRLYGQDFSRIWDRLEKAPATNSMGAEIQSHIRDWHRCQFSEEGLSYTLSISVSRHESKKIVFHYEYSIVISKGPRSRRSSRRIMLCRHVDANLYLSARVSNDDIHCVTCIKSPSIDVTSSNSCVEYKIRFTRNFDYPGPFPDYLWR